MCCEGPEMTRTPTFESLVLPPHALAFRLPRRASKDLGIAGYPILWDGDHSVWHASLSGMERLWKPSEKDPVEFKTICTPSKGKGSSWGLLFIQGSEEEV